MVSAKFLRLARLLQRPLGFALWLLPFYAVPLYAENLRVVLEVSAPHQTFHNGKVAGITTSVVELLLQQAGLTPQYEVYPWARAYRLVATTPNVLIYNIARTPDREDKFEWIGKVASHRFGFLKLAARSDIQVQKLSDIHQYLVGAQREDFTAELLQNQVQQPPEFLELQADLVETWRLLVNGKLDLMIDEATGIDDMLLKFKLKPTDIEFVLFVPELTQQTWIALKKGSDATLLHRLRLAYQKIEDSPELQKAMQRAQ